MAALIAVNMCCISQGSRRKQYVTSGVHLTVHARKAQPRKECRGLQSLSGIRLPIIRCGSRQHESNKSKAVKLR